MFGDIGETLMLAWCDCCNYQILCDDLPWKIDICIHKSGMSCVHMVGVNMMNKVLKVMINW